MHFHVCRVLLPFIQKDGEFDVLAGSSEGRGKNLSGEIGTNCRYDPIVIVITGVQKPTSADGTDLRGRDLDVCGVSVAPDGKSEFEPAAQGEQITKIIARFDEASNPTL